MADLPERLVIDGAQFARVDSDNSIACWTLVMDVDGVGEAGAVALVIEPAAMPEPMVLGITGTVVSRFDEFAEIAADYLRLRLREPVFGLSSAELSALDAAEAPFGEPEAVIWADGSWMVRFAESSLDMADPYGIGVLFDGTTPSAVEDLSDAEPS